MAVTWTAREVVEQYNLVVWNERNLALADELFADTVIRHEVGESHTLTREQAVKRVEDMWQLFDALRFDGATDRVPGSFYQRDFSGDVDGLAHLSWRQFQIGALCQSHTNRNSL